MGLDVGENANGIDLSVGFVFPSTRVTILVASPEGLRMGDTRAGKNATHTENDIICI